MCRKPPWAIPRGNYGSVVSSDRTVTRFVYCQLIVVIFARLALLKLCNKSVQNLCNNYKQAATGKQAADNKTTKSQKLETAHIFFPVGIETAGSRGVTRPNRTGAKDRETHRRYHRGQQRNQIPVYRTVFLRNRNLVFWLPCCPMPGPDLAGGRPVPSYYITRDIWITRVHKQAGY